MQVVEFIHTSGRALPAIAQFPSVEFQPSILTLTVFTGRRFFNALVDSACHKQSTCFEQGSQNAEECPLSDLSASKDGLELLFRAMEGDAPGTISLRQAVSARLSNSQQPCLCTSSRLYTRHLSLAKACACGSFYIRTCRLGK